MWSGDKGWQAQVCMSASASHSDASRVFLSSPVLPGVCVLVMSFSLEPRLNKLFISFLKATAARRTDAVIKCFSLEKLCTDLITLLRCTLRCTPLRTPNLLLNSLLLFFPRANRMCKHAGKFLLYACQWMQLVKPSGIIILHMCRGKENMFLKRLSWKNEQETWEQ